MCQSGLKLAKSSFTLFSYILRNFETKYCNSRRISCRTGTPNSNTFSPLLAEHCAQYSIYYTILTLKYELNTRVHAMKPAFWCRSLSHAMGSECRHDPHGAIQSLLTYSGSIRILNLSSTPIGRCFTRQKSVVDVVGACMDTIFSRQNYRSSLLRKSFFRGARDVGRCSVRRFSGHLDFFHFPHFPIQT